MKISFSEPRLIFKKFENEKVKKKRFSRFRRGLEDLIITELVLCKIILFEN
jgi:hypothetical protein